MDLTINIKLVEVDEYPIVWNDSIEIVFVLKGKIKVGIDFEVNVLDERQIEIINPNEAYWVKKISDENLVLVLNIDPEFFEKYYKDAKDIFFYTDSSDNSQEGDKYRVLRRYIATILFEIESKLDDYEDVVEEIVLKLMYHLLNEFHYLYYEGENLEEDEEELQRYHRVVKYISNNYMNKVSLQEIAEKEFLSLPYLSQKIKETLGYGFNDYLNQIRVEESIKLLLDTDRSISDIAEEVGFSHLRYYSKHFKNHYKITPLQYRKKYKLNPKLLEKKKKILEVNREGAIPYIVEYLEGYQRYNYDNKITKIDIDLEGEKIGKFNGADTIKLGNAFLLLEEENRRAFEDVQKEITFKYCIIENLFSDDMDIYKGKNKRFINWTRVENILDFILKIKLRPIIVYDKIEEHIREEFIKYFSQIYDLDASKWLNPNMESLDICLVGDSINEDYDNMKIVPSLLKKYTYDRERLVFNLIDEIGEDTELNNDCFFGGNGIYTNNYLKKPLYYAYMFLNLLGREILDLKEDYIVTRDEEGFKILFFNPSNKKEEKIKAKKISLNLYNINYDLQITKYQLDKKFGSTYDKWLDLGKPERIDNWHWELLREFVHPDINYLYGKKSIVLNLLVNVNPYGAILLILNKV